MTAERILYSRNLRNNKKGIYDYLILNTKKKNNNNPLPADEIEKRRNKPETRIENVFTPNKIADFLFSANQNND